MPEEVSNQGEVEATGSFSFDHVRSLCSRFAEDANRRPAPPAIHEYLKQVAADAQPTLLRNLLHFDVARRRKVGEEPAMDDYLRELPEFASLIKQVFIETTSRSVSRFSTDLDASATASFFALPSGTHLGNYRLLRELGRGGMGAVFEAEHLQRGDRVALKTLPALDGARLHRFKREFRATANVNHPNLIGLHSLESDGSHWFLTMDLIDGADFLSYVRPEDRLDEGRLRACLAQLVAAVLALHGQHIIHRDLKPSNVMVNDEGRLIVLDFGLVLEHQVGRHVSLDQIAGTPRYMAPEQGRGEILSGAADWYSVGVMLYEALSGKAPHRGKTFEELLRHKSTDDPLPLPPDTPTDLAELALQLLQHDPQKRPDPFEIARLASCSAAVVSAATPSSPTLLVGRSRQLAQLQEAYQHVARQREPAVVFVHGRSGEGKTSLVDRFLEQCRCRARAATVLAGRCYDRETVPFKALDTLIDALATHLRGLPDAEAALLMPDDIGFLASLFPVLQRVACVERLGRKSLQQLDPQQVRTRAFLALRALLHRVTREVPLVLFSDDLQWGDVDSAEVFFEVLKPPESPAVLFIGSYRSDERDSSPFLQKWQSLKAACPSIVHESEVRVEPLTSEQCEELTIALVGDDTPPIRARARQFFEQTGGNPFLLTELIGCYDSAADSFRAMPIHEVIDNKLARLPAEAAPLLEVIAVSGQALAWEEAMQASQHQAAALSVMTHMRSEKLVRLMGPDHQPLVDTYHDKIRETVLERMDPLRRRGLHLALARVIEGASGGGLSSEQVERLESGQEVEAPPRVYDLAYHFDAAGETRAARHYAILAAQQASRQFSQQVAAEQFAVAARNAAGASNAVKFLIARGQGRALSLLGRYQEAERALAGAGDLTNVPFQRAQVLGLSAEIAHKQGQIAQGVKLYSSALRTLGHWAPDSLAGLTVALLRESFTQCCHTLLPQWCYSKAAPLNASEELAVELANRNSIVSYYSNGLRMVWTHLKGFNLAETRQPSHGLAYAYGLHPAPMAALGLCRRGLRYGDRALQLARDFGDRLTEAHAYVMRSMSLFTAGRHAEAVDSANLGVSLCTQAGDPYLIFIAECHVALSAARLGKITAALTTAANGFERAIRMGEDASAGPMMMALALGTDGHFPYPTLRACFRIDEGDHFSSCMTGLAEGIWHSHSQRWEQAVAVLEQAARRARENFIVCPYSVSTFTWLATAQRQYAQSLPEGKLRRSLLRQAWFNLRVGLLSSRLFLCERAQALREYGCQLCAAGKTTRGIIQLQRSARLAQSQGDVWQHAKTQVELARWEPRPDGANRLAEAEATLNEYLSQIVRFRKEHWGDA
jgi:tetratricopeptide (TPR) repeat protein